MYYRNTESLTLKDVVLDSRAWRVVTLLSVSQGSHNAKRVTASADQGRPTQRHAGGGCQAEWLNTLKQYQGGDEEQYTLQACQGATGRRK